LKKDLTKKQELQDVCTVALNLFRQLVVYIAPVLPKLAEQTGDLLNDPILNWKQSQSPLTGTPVSIFTHLMKRIETKDIQAMTEDNQQAAEAATTATESTSQWNDSGEPLTKEPVAEECTIDDFTKVDLRVARIVSAEHVKEANKLLKLTVSLGGEHRKQVFAGIKAAYNPDDLVGRLIIIVANLKPRQMKFGLSEGMVCAAGEGGSEVFLLSPDSGARPGQRVH
jgi:methionyl-tRNA synthetase